MSTSPGGGSSGPGTTGGRVQAPRFWLAMGTRLRKALSSAVSAAILVALAMFAFAYIDSTVSLGGWVFVAVIGAALAGFLSQYYLWGRHEE